MFRKGRNKKKKKFTVSCGVIQNISSKKQKKKVLGLTLSEVRDLCEEMTIQENVKIFELY